MKTQYTIRLDAGIAAWLKTYGDDSLVEGIRRAAREVQHLREYVRHNPQTSLTMSFEAIEKALASLGVGARKP